MTFTIDARFNGPPESGNGGYSAGLVAAEYPASVGGTPEVTLRMPPPLDTALRATPADGGVAVHTPDGALVASAARSAEPLGPPVPGVSLAEARAAASAYEGFVDHPFPTCFVCGPARPTDDGLRIFPGRLSGGRTAAPWRVPTDVDTAMVWAALDCPGGWAALGKGRPYVLGRIAAVVEAVPAAGSECVVVGALTGVEGRKARVQTALYAPGGDLLAHARATWIAI
ncbi:MAG TPA: hypothetical protein VGJ53_09255 [Micromonosporaceae bacterium]